MKIYGITDPSCFAWRCPTLALRVVKQNADQTPLVLATKLGDRGFFTWDGNYYALNLTERLDVEKTGGFLRIGLVHYNTLEEVDRLLEALGKLLDRESMEMQDRIKIVKPGGRGQPALWHVVEERDQARKESE